MRYLPQAAIPSWHCYFGSIYRSATQKSHSRNTCGAAGSGSSRRCLRTSPVSRLPSPPAGTSIVSGRVTSALKVIPLDAAAAAAAAGRGSALAAVSPAITAAVRAARKIGRHIDTLRRGAAYLSDGDERRRQISTELSAAAAAFLTARRRRHGKIHRPTA